MADFWSTIDAVGSFGGMLLAGIAGWVAYRLFKVESRRDFGAEEFRREQAEEKTRTQAASVGFWYDLNTRKMVILNASNLPIYRVALHALTDLRSEFLPDVEFRVAMQPGELQAVDGDRMRETLIALEERLDLPVVFPTWALSFIDNSGMRWLRDLNGRLALLGRLRTFESDVSAFDAMVARYRDTSRNG